MQSLRNGGSREPHSLTAWNVLFALVLHPLAWISLMIDLDRRADLGFSSKFAWALIGLFWGFGPILYVLNTGGRI